MIKKILSQKANHKLKKDIPMSLEGLQAHQKDDLFRRPK